MYKTFYLISYKYRTVPKYSTGSSSPSDTDDTENACCELCGDTDKRLTTVSIESATITACYDCKPDDDSGKNNGQNSSSNQEKDVNENSRESKSEPTNESKSEQTNGYTISNPDSSWVEKDRPDYGNVNTPYLIPNYNEKITMERNNLNLTQEELSEEADVPLDSIESLETGDAINDGIRKDTIESIEKILEIEIQSE